MSVSLKFIFVFILLILISFKLRAKTWLSIPAVRIAEAMDEELLTELLYYAKALNINDSATIQVRYSLHLPQMTKGLIQYKNIGFGKERHQVMIWVNRRLTPSEQSMTLAHEMVHAAQYIHGLLVLKDNRAIWRDQHFIVDRIPYEDRPWEKEAHEWGYVLRKEYLGQRIQKKHYQLGIHPFPESL